MKHGIVIEKSDRMYGYFAWPSIARLADGKFMLVCSGFRMAHFCPFGQVVKCYSNDGFNWSQPVTALKTPLDTRDSGIIILDDNKVLITSFTLNNNQQPAFIDTYIKYDDIKQMCRDKISSVTKEDEDKYLGALTCLSVDGGYTFSQPRKCPVASPHSGCKLPDGSILIVGNLYDGNNGFGAMCAVKSTDGGKTWHDKVMIDTPKFIRGTAVLFCEANAQVVHNGRILVHFRCQNFGSPCNEEIFTIYQSYSDDNGKTFSQPVALNTCGAPPHLMLHSSGDIICSFGRRTAPFGQMVMVSKDNGQSWGKPYQLRDDGLSWDLGYPCSVEMDDKSILTVYYQKKSLDGNAGIYYTNWTLDEIQ